MVARRGASTLGCLIPLLILAVVIYFAIDFGTAYFRYYQFKDAMGQEARFSYEHTDAQITTRLSALADSLELPAGAELITILRAPSSSSVSISSDYDDVVNSIQKSARDLAPWHHEFRVKLDDGSMHWLLGNALPQRDADGSVLWHGFITDITGRKQLEANIVAAKHQAEEANLAKSSLQ